MYRLTLIFFIAAIASQTLFGQRTMRLAPNGPGVDAHWPSAAKDGFGTSTTLQSKVWFTLNNGVMTEVYYPTLDKPNTQSLEFIFCTAGVCSDEASGMSHSLSVLDKRALTFQQTNSTTNLVLTKTYTTDIERATVLIEVNTQSKSPDTSVYVYFDPSLNNSGMHDTAWSSDGALLASDGNITSALVSSSGFEVQTNIFARSDVQRLKPDSWGTYDRAENGNVVQVGKLRDPRKFTLALSFAATPAEAVASAAQSLKKGFANCRREYEGGWHAYVSSLRPFAPRHAEQLSVAAMVLKASEDKTYRGAFIASPSIPWGGGPNANESMISGYHAVWARDLYQIATALVAIGDQRAANRALDYLFNVQQKPDGSFPQNSWADGRPIGGGTQMDQVAFPIILAYQLGRTDTQTWQRHIKLAADFIVVNGPATNQDRWEEKAGYSPSTIAAEIAALVCAAHVASTNHDQASSTRYLKTADEWNARVDSWTATSNGPLRDKSYFLRLTEKFNPNEGAEMEINSGGGKYDQRSIVDAGFLELVRLGIRRADDPLIRKSVAVIDSQIKLDTPVGPGWYRYNHDAYGERPDGRPYDGKTGVGRLWTLLTGERGEYELAAGNKTRAQALLDTMAKFANAGMMIPEQVWDRGDNVASATGSATPLVWSMAQFIRLAANIDRGRNSETPQVVADRYTKKSEVRGE